MGGHGRFYALWGAHGQLWAEPPGAAAVGEQRVAGRRGAARRAARTREQRHRRAAVRLLPRARRPVAPPPAGAARDPGSAGAPRARRGVAAALAAHATVRGRLDAVGGPVARARGRRRRRPEDGARAHLPPLRRNNRTPQVHPRRRPTAQPTPAQSAPAQRPRAAASRSRTASRSPAACRSTRTRCSRRPGWKTRCTPRATGCRARGSTSSTFARSRRTGCGR